MLFRAIPKVCKTEWPDFAISSIDNSGKVIKYQFLYISLNKFTVIMNRKAKISRKTKETSISVEVNIDGKGKYKIDTGIGFLNHMLEQLSKHSLILFL